MEMVRADDRSGTKPLPNKRSVGKETGLLP